MSHILIVCTANICRSPVGEGLLRQRLHERGLTDWTVSSAGTWAQVERSASQYSVEVMADQGIDISTHRARMIDAKLLKEADLVLCMESGHAEALRAEFPPYASNVYLFSEMIGKQYSISDPYGGSLDAYQAMAYELNRLVDEGLERIVELAEGKG